jgi:hypothetical protein
MAGPEKKRVSKFEEQSHYVIQNKWSVKKQSQNKAILGGWENRRCGEGNAEL